MVRGLTLSRWLTVAGAQQVREGQGAAAAVAAMPEGQQLSVAAAASISNASQQSAAQVSVPESGYGHCSQPLQGVVQER